MFDLLFCSDKVNKLSFWFHPAVVGMFPYKTQIITVTNKASFCILLYQYYNLYCYIYVYTLFFYVFFPIPTMIFILYSKCNAIELRSGDWFGHSRTFHFLVSKSYVVALAVCFGSLSCCPVRFRFPLAAIHANAITWPPPCFIDGMHRIMGCSLSPPHSSFHHSGRGLSVNCYPAFQF